MIKNKILKTIIVLIIGLLLGSCYLMNEPTSGDITLKASLPARSPGEENWVVGLVVDAAFENDLIEMMRLFDRSDWTGDDTYEDQAEDILEKMLEKGAVRFDGGRFFFQFKMSGAGDSGNFVISGIPANKKYFLYILIFNKQISSIDDFGEDEYESDIYMEMRYYDPAYYGGADLGVPKGWYYFHNWDYFETAGQPALDGSTIIWDKNGTVPHITNQPFLVEPGKSATIEILLTDDLPS